MTTNEPTIQRRPRGKRTAVPDASTLTAGTPAPVAGLLGATTHPQFLEATVLHAHPANPPHRSDSDFEDLAEAIRADSEITQPITVRPSPTTAGEYEVLDGHRRLAAARLLGMVLVPVRVKDLDDAEALFLVLRANQARRDFSPLEEAHIVQATLDLPGMTQKRIAERVGRSPSWVSERARAAKTPARILEALDGKQPTFDQLEAIRDFDGSPEVERLIEAAGTSDFAMALSIAQRRRTQAKLMDTADQALRATGATRIDGEVPADRVTDWDLCVGINESTNFEKLVEKINDTHMYDLAHGWLRVYRLRTPDELARQVEQAERDAARTARHEAEAAEREAHLEAQERLREFTDTTSGLRRDFLMSAIHDRTSVTAKQLPAIADFYATHAATAALTEDLWHDAENLRTWLHTPAPESPADVDYDEEVARLGAEIAALPTPRRLLLLAVSLIEPISDRAWTHEPELQITRVWYDLLTTLGYTPSTMEVDALAVPEVQAA